MQKYERLVEEDLNVGTERVWLQGPSRGKLRSTQVGLHTFARGLKAYETMWTPGAITADSDATTTLTVPDADPGDIVLAEHSKILTNALRITGHVSAADTVKAVIHNPTAASVTVAAGVLRVILFPFYSGPSLTGDIDIGDGDGTKIFTPTITGGSGDYTYAWSAWTEYGGSEGSPAYTSSDEVWELDTVPIGFPITAGFVKLVVTDNLTSNMLTLGPEGWTYP